jgi:hypothetical protein
MLDAGRAKKERKDQTIKHYSYFESEEICKLINSPDYLGRGYVGRNKDAEKYIKNKRICKLIDELRYNVVVKEPKSLKKISAKLHYAGSIDSDLNGGNAKTSYGPCDKLNLGGAGSECYEPSINLDDDTFSCFSEENNNSAKLHYRGFRESQLNGGNAKALYETRHKLDLGDAGPECYEPLHKLCEEKDNSAKLHYKDFKHSHLNGGNAKTSYGSGNKLDLGSAGLEPYNHHNAKLHCKEFNEKQLNGGNAKTWYAPNNRLDLGTSGNECHDNYSASLHYSGFTEKQLSGGNAESLYETVDKLDLGDAGVKSYDYNSADLHYKGFTESNLNAGDARTSYANKLDLGDAGTECYKSVVNDTSGDLHYDGFVATYLNGGNAKASYANILDLGNAGIETSDLPANLNYNEFTEKKLNGGNASVLYTHEDKLDLGGASSECH